MPKDIAMHSYPSFRVPSVLRSPRPSTRGYLSRMALRYYSRSPLALYGAILRDALRYSHRHFDRVANALLSLLMLFVLSFGPFSQASYSSGLASSSQPQVTPKTQPSTQPSQDLGTPKVPLGGEITW